MNSGKSPYLAVWPPFLPDEAFSSVIYRYHILSGNFAFATTFNDLFDGPVHSTPLIPTALGVLASRLQPLDENIGLALLNRHTLYPYLRPFNFSQSEEVMEKALLSSKLSTGGTTKIRNAFAQKPLEPRFCPCCISDDLKKHGISYFRRSHQIPEMRVCPHHAVRLQSSCPKCGPGQRHPNQIGEPAYCPNCRSYFSDSFDRSIEASSSIDLGIAQAIWTIIESRFPQLNVTILRETYINELAAKGMFSGKTFTVTKLAIELQDFFGEAFLASHGASISQTAASNNFWFYRLLRFSTSLSKPIFHLLLIFYLFNSLTKFVERYNQAAEKAGLTPLILAAQDFEYFYSSAMLKSSASEPLQNDAVIATFSKRETTNTTTDKNDKRITELFYDGYGLISISRVLNIPYSQVSEFAKNNKEIEAKRLLKIFDKKRTKHRDRVIQILRENPNLDEQHLKLLSPSIAVWLRENDDEWLKKMLSVAEFEFRSDLLKLNKFAKTDTEIAAHIIEKAERFRNDITFNRRITRRLLTHNTLLTSSGRHNILSIQFPIAVQAVADSIETKEKWHRRKLHNAWKTLHLEGYRFSARDLVKKAKLVPADRIPMENFIDELLSLPYFFDDENQVISPAKRGDRK